MAIEASILDEDTIKVLIRQYYGIEVVSIEKIAEGTANCYKIIAKKADYFLKEFQHSYDEDDVLKEVKLLRYLEKKRFPVPRVIMTKDGAGYVLYIDRILELQKFIDGTCYGANSVPQPVIIEAAGLLGKLTSLIFDFDLPADMDQEWLSRFDIREASRAYRATLNMLEDSNESYERYESIKADLRFRLFLNGKLPMLSTYFKGITYCPSHGDFTNNRILCDEKGIKAFVNFSYAHRVPIVWELMRFYVLSSPEFTAESGMDIESFKQYVARYKKSFPLTRTDLMNLPYVYLYSLCRNKYAYRRYLTETGEEREAEFQFFSKRTRVSRYIYENAEKISDELLTLK